MNRYLLTDSQWMRIAYLLLGKPTDKGGRAVDNCLFVEAVLWIARTGSPWRDLPPAFGNWHSVYVRFARWETYGVWHRIAQTLQGKAVLEDLFIDSTIVRAHQHASDAQKTVPSSAGVFTRRADHQDSCLRRYTGQSCAAFLPVGRRRISHRRRRLLPIFPPMQSLLTKAMTVMPWLPRLSRRGRIWSLLHAAIDGRLVQWTGIAKKREIWSSDSSIGSNSFGALRPVTTNWPVGLVHFSAWSAPISGYCERALRV